VKRLADYFFLFQIFASVAGQHRVAIAVGTP